VADLPPPTIIGQTPPAILGPAPPQVLPLSLIGDR